MADSRQFSLFGRKNVPDAMHSRRKRSRLVSYLVWFAGKAKLKLFRPRKEKGFHRITRQYGNVPLFYGLPTMERWKEWEKRRDKGKGL